MRWQEIQPGTVFHSFIGRDVAGTALAQVNKEEDGWHCFYRTSVGRKWRMTETQPTAEDAMRAAEAARATES